MCGAARCAAARGARRAHVRALHVAELVHEQPERCLVPAQLAQQEGALGRERARASACWASARAHAVDGRNLCKQMLGANLSRTPDDRGEARAHGRELRRDRRRGRARLGGRVRSGDDACVRRLGRGRSALQLVQLGAQPFDVCEEPASKLVVQPRRACVRAVRQTIGHVARAARRAGR